MAGAVPGPVDSLDLRAITDCPQFLQGGCSKGDSCTFRHSITARSNGTDCRFWQRGICRAGKICPFRHQQIMVGKDAKPSVPCYYFKQGHCAKGEMCPFLHSFPSIPPIDSTSISKPGVVMSQTLLSSTVVQQNGEWRREGNESSHGVGNMMEIDNSSHSSVGKKDGITGSLGTENAFPGSDMVVEDSRLKEELQMKRKRIEESLRKRLKQVKQELTGGEQTTKMVDVQKMKPTENNSISAVSKIVVDSSKKVSNAFVQKPLQVLEKAIAEAIPVEGASLIDCTPKSNANSKVVAIQGTSTNSSLAAVLEKNARQVSDSTRNWQGGARVLSTQEDRLVSEKETAVPFRKILPFRAFPNSEDNPLLNYNGLFRSVSPVKSNIGFSGPRSLSEILEEKKKARRAFNSEAEDLSKKVRSVKDDTEMPETEALKNGEGSEDVTDINGHSGENKQTEQIGSTPEKLVKKESPPSSLIPVANVEKFSEGISKARFQAPRPLSELMQMKRKSIDGSESEKEKQELKPQLPTNTFSDSRLSIVDTVIDNGISVFEDKAVVMSFPLKLDSGIQENEGNASKGASGSDLEKQKSWELKVCERPEDRIAEEGHKRSKSEEVKLQDSGNPGVPNAFSKDESVIDSREVVKEVVEEKEAKGETVSLVSEKDEENDEEKEAKEETVSLVSEEDEGLLEEGEYGGEDGFDEEGEDTLDDTLLDLEELVESEEEDLATKFDHYFR